MRRSQIIVVLASILVLAMGLGSLYAGAKLKRTMHPREMFDHDMHTENFFTPANVPCETCHINDEYEWKKMNHDGCHKCHGGRAKSVMAATSDCSMCHTNWEVTPADHRANWEKAHRIKAKAAAKTCKSCHKDNFCMKCHEKRNDIILQVHKRNYKYFHSIDARANPRKCDSCHQVGYCTRCHSSRRGR